jgi:predicted membrane metal-binding protein
MFGFWCVFIVVLVWDNGKVQYLNTALVFGIVITILGAFFLLLRKHIR